MAGAGLGIRLTPVHIFRQNGQSNANFSKRNIWQILGYFVLIILVQTACPYVIQFLQNRAENESLLAASKERMAATRGFDYLHLSTFCPMTQKLMPIFQNRILHGRYTDNVSFFQCNREVPTFSGFFIMREGEKQNDLGEKKFPPAADKLKGDVKIDLFSLCNP